MSNSLMNPFGSEKTDSGGALAQLERREEAEIMAMVAVAKRFPRDPRAACDKILMAFARQTLAEEATYSYSRGGQEISDLTIRAMEAIAIAWQNIDSSWNEISRGVGDDGVPYSLVEAKAWDLESTTRKRISFIVRHWRDTKRGGYALKDERDIYELCANMAQRRVRACLGSLIPEDVKALAREQADTTMNTKTQVTPELIADMLERFSKFGVTKEHIEAKIQRNIDSMAPAQAVRMKKIWRSLTEGVGKPSDFFDGFEETPPKDGSTTTLDELKKKAEPPAATPAPTPAPTPEQQRVSGIAADIAAKEAATRDQPDLLGERKQDDAPISFDDLKAKMSAARKLDTLDGWYSMRSAFKDVAQLAILDEIYNARKAQLETKQ